MNKTSIARTLQFIFLIILLSTLPMLSSVASASLMNNSQYSLLASVSSSSSNMSNSVFKTGASFESIAGLTNSSSFAAAIGIQATIPLCNNNIVEHGELCDGTSLEGATCQSQGFSSGVLSCSNNCLTLDTSACITTSPQQQGGVTAEPIGKAGETTTTTPTSTSTTTTSTTLQQPQKEQPSIIDKASELIEAASKTLTNIQRGSRTIYIIILTLASLLAMYASYLLLIFAAKKIREIRNKKIKAKDQEEAFKENKEILKAYIKENMEKGYSLTELSSILLKNNWTKEEIKAAINDMLKEIR